MSVYFNPAVRSDGQTIDTDRGPVDTIVIERALCGLSVRPNRAEDAVLMTLIPPGCDRELATRVAEATGRQLKSVERTARRHRNATAAAAGGEL